MPFGERMIFRDNLSGIPSAKSLLLAGTALCLAGCVINTSPTGPLQYDSFHLDKDRSEVVKVNLNMGAGKLQVGSGTEKLLQAYFTYNVPGWKPEVRYDPRGARGNLTFRQPDHHGPSMAQPFRYFFFQH